MSRDLPAVPNLEHLRKQAKKRLRELQRQDPHAVLADAQHAVAREYGFRTWPELKARVEVQAAGNRGGDGGHIAPASAEPPPEGVFHRFTPRAKQAVFFARYEAAGAGRRLIEPRDVLLGAMRAAAGQLRTIVEGAGLRIDELRVAMADAAPAPALGTEIHIPFGSPVFDLFRNAAQEADRLGQREIGVAHIVLALREIGGAAGAVTRTSLEAEALQRAAAAARTDDQL